MTTIIHIGSSKAMSTSIQSYFQNLGDDFFYFGMNFDIQKFKVKGVGSYYLDEDCRQLTKVLVNLDRFKGLDPQLKKNIQKKVKLANDQNKIFFYSCELFCESSSLYLMMEILKEIFNDFKILYITRNQYDILKSVYCYEGHKFSYWTGKQKYKFIPFSTFFETALHTHKTRGGHKSNYWVHDCIRIYNFHKITEILSKFLSKEDLLIFPFEEIQKKGDLNLITKFIAEKVNKKIPSQILSNNKSLYHVNVSNRKGAFYKTYAILSALNIDPKKLNSKVKKFFNYKKLFKNSEDFKIDDKYFYEIKNLYLEDNLKLIEKFDFIKEHKSKYLFEK